MAGEAETEETGLGMAMVLRFTAVAVKIQRAKQHLYDLQPRVETFIEGRSYRIRRQEDRETRDLIFTMEVTEAPPIMWSAIVGDVIHNLAASLDLLVWQLVLANNGKPGRHSKFPFAETAKEFDASFAGKVRGMGDAAVELIKATKPHRGGNEVLYALHRLDIDDKHRLLIPVYGVHGVPMVNVLTNLPGQKERRSVITTTQLTLRPAENGAEVLRVKFDTLSPKVDVDPVLFFDIAFGQGEIVEHQPLLTTLSKFLNTVEGIVEPFRPLLT